MELPELSYNGLVIRSQDEVHVSSVIVELAEQKVDHTVLLRWQNGEWSAASLTFALAGLEIEGTGSQLVCVGIDGTAAELAFPGRFDSHIDDSTDGPSHLVHLKTVAKIGNTLYAAGMARRVYRRTAPGQWQPVDHGVFVPRERRTEPCGFLTLSGSGEGEMYAAGLRGEVWYFDRRTWIPEASPTNVALATSQVLSDGRILFAGLGGVVIYGRHNAWRELSHELTRRDFWGSATLNGKVYLSNYEGIFVCAEDMSALEKVHLTDDETFTTAYLHARDGIMWSVGHKDIAASSNGVDWSVVELPRVI